MMAYLQYGRNAMRRNTMHHPLLFAVQGVRYRKLEVILTTSIDKLGKAGETVKVAPGFFRNHLMPKLLAVPNIDKFAHLIHEQRKIYQPQEVEEVKEVVKSEETNTKEYEAAANRLAKTRVNIRKFIIEGKGDVLREPVTKEEVLAEIKRQLQVHIEPKNFASVSIAEALGEQGLKDLMMHESDRNCSDSAKVDPSETQVPNCDLSRGELLEALCHSQTRAREAEKLAQEACDEKEHVFDLFFQQASCLFAYKQWLRVLQLETLCLHLRSKDHSASFAPPSSLLPRGMSLRKNKFRDGKKVEKERFNNIRKCAVAFAIGLSLAGAGLLVGWTVGCLFPAF